MRWLFYLLLILNVVYLVVGLVTRATPDVGRSPLAVSAAPQTLTLLSELETLPRSSQSVAVSMPALCPVIGPWPALAEADQASKTLVSAGYQVELVSLQVPRDRLHWVYLPSYQDREAALRTLRQLQTAGVDSFIVTAGDDVNAISLGYFGKADSARGLATKMRTAGYQAEVRETARRVTEYWLRVDHASVTDEGAALRQLLARQQELTGDHVACHTVLPAEAPALVPEGAAAVATPDVTAPSLPESDATAMPGSLP